MVTFVSKENDTATLCVVCGNLSKAISAVKGEDSVVLDDVLNKIVDNENIKHVRLSVRFTDDEANVHNYLNTIQDSCGSIFTDKEEDGDSEEEADTRDYKCPKCGKEDGALYDKHNNKYPCIDCIKIDIGLQLEKKYKKKHDDLEEYNKKLGDEFRE